MTSLKTLSTKPLPVIPKWIIVLILLVSIIGFVDATYLTVKHYNGTSINCSLIKGCDKVTTSKYSTLGNIPTSLFGAVYYLIIFIAALAYVDAKKKFFLNCVVCLSIIGFLVSLGLIYLQIFVIGAICLYCMVSAASSTSIFVLGILVFRFLTRESDGLR